MPHSDVSNIYLPLSSSEFSGGSPHYQFGHSTEMQVTSRETHLFQDTCLKISSAFHETPLGYVVSGLRETKKKRDKHSVGKDNTL